mgnify:CR=1 FL=1
MKQEYAYDLALVISDLGAGGAQRVLVTLANEWSRAGRSVVVITFSSPDSDFFSLSDAVTRKSLNVAGATNGFLGAVKANIRRVLVLRRCLIDLRPRSVLGFIAATNVLLILATMGVALRVIISERNDPAKQSLGRFWGRLRRYFYRYADVVTANSAAALDTLSEYVPKHKLVLVRNPVSVSEENAHAKLRPGPRRLLAVGRLYPQKGYDVLLKAFAASLLARDGWKLRVLGEGPLRASLEELSGALGISGAVEWLGMKSDPLPEYRAADIFVLASRYEGTPNALLEAMSVGIPVVVTDALPGALEFVVHGETGIVVKVEDPDDLAKALTSLANDDQLRVQLGVNGRERVTENSLDKVLQDWERILGWE